MNCPAGFVWSFRFPKVDILFAEVEGKLWSSSESETYTVFQGSVWEVIVVPLTLHEQPKHWPLAQLLLVTLLQPKILTAMLIISFNSCISDLRKKNK